jgi:hypothetical protein
MRSKWRYFPKLKNERVLITKALTQDRTPLKPRHVIASIEKNRPLKTNEKNEIKKILVSESKKQKGLFFHSKQGYELRSRVEKRLKENIKREAAAFGFQIRNGSIIRPELLDKDAIRAFHAAARKAKYESHLDFIQENEKQLLEHFADGRDINPNQIWPKLKVVKANTENSLLFRYASLLWSIPVSEGYGRRVRFLVRDEHTDKLIGLFALGDPVFNLSCRDDWIGWNYHDREKRLYNVMDIFVLGSVPPYNILLGGKLVAMLAASDKVQRIIRNRYYGTRTVIKKEKKDPRLVLLTTGAALGKSALYDRITFDRELLFQRIGESKGWGHFHLNHGLFDELRCYLEATSPNKTNNRFGSGPNWKIRTMRQALSRLNMPTDLLQHGVNRDIYGIPLTKNYSEFLRGETNRIEYKKLAFNDLASYWKERWLIGRVQRKPEFKEVNKMIVSRLIHNAGEISERTANQVCY